MPKSILLELAENTGLASRWDESVDVRFGAAVFYSRMKTPHELFNIIRASQNTQIKKNLMQIKRFEINEESDYWSFFLSRKEVSGHIYIKTLDSLWVLFSKSGNLLNYFTEKFLNYVPGISAGWLSYEQMQQIIQEFANYGRIKATARAPSFKIPARAFLTVQQRKQLPDWYFEDIGFTVMFWAPRRVFNSNNDLIFDQFKVSKEYLKRIDNVELGAEFTNPGKARVTVNTNSVVKHLAAVPEATQKVFDTVLALSADWIKRFNSCLPSYAFKRNEVGDIMNLKLVEPCKKVEFYASNDNDKKITVSDLIKLQQMLTVGDQTDLLGFLNKADESSFDLNCIYTKFSDEANVVAKAMSNKIKIEVTPGRVPGPFVINQIYKITSQFAWEVSKPEIKNG